MKQLVNLKQNSICEAITRREFFSNIIYFSLLLGLFLIYTPRTYAAECESGDANTRIQCFQKLVTELKDGMRELIKKAKADMAAAKVHDEENRKTQAQLQNNLTTKEKIIQKQKEIIAKQDEDRKLADKQVSKLRLCCEGKVGNAFRANIGIGATNQNSDLEGALLLGLGIGRVNLHAFLQSDNSGLIIGYEF